jgi:hypothetical protein
MNASLLPSVYEIVCVHVYSPIYPCLSTYLSMSNPISIHVYPHYRISGDRGLRPDTETRSKFVITLALCNLGSRYKLAGMVP